MSVININEKIVAKKKQDLLEVLDELRSRIECGEIEEFVAASGDQDGNVQIHVCTKDMLGSVGLFEIGKNILIRLHHDD
jgi:hypothetical protein